MRLVAVSVGRPRDVIWEGTAVRTSIYKEQVQGRVRVAGHNLDGDDQSDRTVHGGPRKAVYAYPSEHYAPWRRELPESPIEWGGFGENLTTEGLVEDDVCVGDRLRVGSVELVVTQPRSPCTKLNLRFRRHDMIERFLASGRSGFYLSVAVEGELGAGDRIERIDRDGHGVSVADLARISGTGAVPREVLERAASHPGLPESWLARVRRRMETAGG